MVTPHYYTFQNLERIPAAPAISVTWRPSLSWERRVFQRNFFFLACFLIHRFCMYCFFVLPPPPILVLSLTSLYFWFCVRFFFLNLEASSSMMRKCFELVRHEKDTNYLFYSSISCFCVFSMFFPKLFASFCNTVDQDFGEERARPRQAQGTSLPGSAS